MRSRVAIPAHPAGMGAPRASNGTITFGNWAHLLNLAHHPFKVTSQLLEVTNHLAMVKAHFLEVTDHLLKVKTHFWRALLGGAFAEFGEVQVDEGGLNVAVTEVALELPQGESRPLATDSR